MNHSHFLVRTPPLLEALKRILVASNGMAAAKVMMSMRQWAHMEAAGGIWWFYYKFTMVLSDHIRLVCIEHASSVHSSISAPKSSLHVGESENGFWPKVSW